MQKSVPEVRNSKHCQDYATSRKNYRKSYSALHNFPRHKKCWHFNIFSTPQLRHGINMKNWNISAPFFLLHISCSQKMFDISKFCCVCCVVEWHYMAWVTLSWKWSSDISWHFPWSEVPLEGQPTNTSLTWYQVFQLRSRETNLLKSSSQTKIFCFIFLGRKICQQSAFCHET